MATILVIDDEPGIRSTVKDILEDEKHRVNVAEDAIVGLEILEREEHELVILDVWLPRMGGLEALEEIKKKRPETEVLMVSGHATIDMAVQALKNGAFDFIEKPLSIDRILISSRNALRLSSLRKENREIRNASMSSVGELVGSSKVMLELKERIARAAESDARILITGENGTGKELAARSIFFQSKRNTKPFVELNCAAIPDSLIESELFGHERGAFTDAVSRRVGRFEAAHGGTLFLDEVADLSIQAQAKVLRVLQEMRFERLGGEKSIAVDVRVIAATNKNIKAEISAGKFREDLYFRLAVIPIHIPPLRERTDDIPELCRYFLARTAAAGSPTREIAAEGLDLIVKHEWPGNVRELSNFLERLAVYSEEAIISAETIKKAFSEENLQSQPRRSLSRYRALPYSHACDLFEKDYLEEKLEECEYNIAKTARILDMQPSSLHARLKKLGIERSK